MRRKSAKEAHEFEREMERDPFLYEAMEGFEEMLASDIQQALDELDDRLDEKVEKRFAFQWWQAAAVGAVIIVGVTAVIFIGGEDPAMMTDPVVEEETKPEPTIVEEEPAEYLDTIDAVATMDESDYGSAPRTLDQSAESSVLEVEVSNVELADEGDDFKFSSQTEDLESTTTYSEPVQEMEEEIAVVSEDAESLASDEAPGYTREPINKSEVKRSMVPAEAEASPNEDVLQASPIGGMDSYLSYLKKNIQTSSGMPSGFVVLSFEFERDGSPKRITVDKSLCTACDAEAIRLVNAGPKWNAPNRKERMTLQVQFP